MEMRDGHLIPADERMSQNLASASWILVPTWAYTPSRSQLQGFQQWPVLGIGRILQDITHLHQWEYGSAEDEWRNAGGAERLVVIQVASAKVKQPKGNQSLHGCVATGRAG